MKTKLWKDHGLYKKKTKSGKKKSIWFDLYHDFKIPLHIFKFLEVCISLCSLSVSQTPAFS